MSKHLRTAIHFIPLFSLGAFLLSPVIRAQQLSLSRDNATVLVEPYAPNIVRVSISLRREDALAAPGYGIVATPTPTGWIAGSETSGDTLRSDRLVVTVSPQGPKWIPTGTRADIAKFFNGSTPGVDLSIRTHDNADLVRMQGWQMSIPNHKDGNADILYDRRPTDAPLFPGRRQLRFSTR